jgi:hypothetical protein
MLYLKERRLNHEKEVQLQSLFNLFLFCGGSEE